MKKPPHEQPSVTRAEKIRSAIIIVEVIVLLLAIVVHNMNQRNHEMMVYVEDQMVHVADLKTDVQQPLFPLEADCELIWITEDGEHRATTQSMSAVNNAPDFIAADSLQAFTFVAQGGIDVTVRGTQTILRHDGGDIVLSKACTTVDTHRDMLVYAWNGNLYVMDSRSHSIAGLIGQREEVMWAGSTRYILTQDTLAAHYDETGIAGLPAGAEVVGVFETSGGLTIDRIDPNHVRMTFNEGEVVIGSFGAPLFTTEERNTPPGYSREVIICESRDGIRVADAKNNIQMMFFRPAGKDNSFSFDMSNYAFYPDYAYTLESKKPRECDGPAMGFYTDYGYTAVKSRAGYVDVFFGRNGFIRVNREDAPRNLRSMIVYHVEDEGLFMADVNTQESFPIVTDACPNADFRVLYDDDFPGWMHGFSYFHINRDFTWIPEESTLKAGFQAFGEIAIDDSQYPVVTLNFDDESMSFEVNDCDRDFELIVCEGNDNLYLYNPQTGKVGMFYYHSRNHSNYVFDTYAYKYEEDRILREGITAQLPEECDTAVLSFWTDQGYTGSEFTGYRVDIHFGENGTVTMRELRNLTDSNTAFSPASSMKANCGGLSYHP